MFAETFSLFDNEKLGLWLYTLVNIFIVGVVKSASCWCWNGSGAIEIFFFPLIIAAAILAIIAIKNLIKEFWDFGEWHVKFALLYMILSFVIIAV